MKPEDALRRVMVAELNTITEYRNIADDVTCPFCANLIRDIANEEVVHVGEALALYKKYYPKDAELLQKGIDEALKPESMLEPIGGQAF